MVECLTRDRRAMGSSHTCGTATVCVLEQDTLLFQPKETNLTRLKESIQINKIRLTHTQRKTEIIFMTHFFAKLNYRFYCLN